MNGNVDVALKDIKIMFGTVKVLENLHLDVAKSEFLVLLGPSGCGKSTLLNAVAGLLDVREGQIWIAGRNVTWEEPKDRGIAMVFQSYALYPRMSVRGNMSFGLKVAGTPAAEIEKRVREAAELLKITDLLERRPSELSGGQRQRVAIGRALVRKVGVFLFDEPLSNLDAQLRAELRVEIKRLHQQLGATMIYVTHDQIEALTLADRIAVMNGGVIQQLDTPAKIYREPKNRFVASFVGSPAMNFVDGAVENSGGAPVFAGGGLRVPLAGYAFAGNPAAGTATLGIRPEHVAFGPAAGSGGFEVGVDLVEPMGADSLVWCRTSAGVAFSVRMPGDAAIRKGERLAAAFPAANLSLFDTASGQRL
jgi:multiple sugar transport system ATP-binding protein